jgi:hypothetical protein
VLASSASTAACSSSTDPVSAWPGIAEPKRHLLPAHPAAPLAVVADDLAATPSHGPCRDRAAWITQPSSVTSRPKHAHGSSTRTSHMAAFLRWLVGSPKGVPLEGANAGLQRSRNGACRGRKVKKKRFLEIGELCPWAGRPFFRPSTGDEP